MMEPPILKGKIGGNYNFECVPGLKDVKWFFNKQELPNSANVHFQMLEIRNLRLFHAGSYYCYWQRHVHLHTKTFGGTGYVSRGILIPIGRYNYMQLAMQHYKAKAVNIIVHYGH